MSIFKLILIQVVLILLNAVFACAEIAVISVNDNKLSRLAENGDKCAMTLSKIKSKPAKFLATIQVAITMSGFLGSAFAADNFSEIIVKNLLKTGINISYETLDMISVILITVILSFFTLIFGELVPKRIAMQKSQQLALSMSSLISVISKLFAPLVFLLTVTTNFILKIIGINSNENDEKVGEEDILMIVDEGTRKGYIDKMEGDLIQNIFDFDDTPAKEILTHRTKICVLYLDDTDEKWERVIYENKYSHFPICDKSKDNIVGVLNTRYYFRLKDKSRENIMENAVEEPYFIYESKKADLILKSMKENGKYFAIVLDEHSGTTGILTANDLIEELIGEFSINTN